MVRTLYGVGGTDHYVDEFIQADPMGLGGTAGRALEHAIQGSRRQAAGARPGTTCHAVHSSTP